MSNSPLVTYTNLSPNCTKPRRGKILYIVPHCIVGQWTAKQGCDYFAVPGRGASANYVVGKDGSIGLSVDESNRAWTTGGDLTTNGLTGATIDHYAVTIEVASDTYQPFKITDAAYQALIKLMADIARRNGIRELKWRASKSLVGKPEEQNVLVHRWFATKTCPGDYMYNHMGDIVTKANLLLTGKEEKELTESEVKALVKKEWASLGDDLRALIKSITRDEVAKMEQERAKLPVSKWAVPFVQKAIDNGLMAENGEGTIDRPQSNLTRQEAATIADAILDAVTKKPPDAVN